MKNYTSLIEIRKDIELNQISCKELVQGYCQNISQYSNLNAFVEVFEKEALHSAAKIDEKIKSNSAGRLAGLVIGIKDNLCYKGHYSTAASKILSGFKSVYSATAIKRLIEEDAIILGRLNCDEFAMGSSNENSIYGASKNPINELYSPGGSSGGSAAAVKANLCQVALGTDTGGSIRQPAAFCGVIGLKPTYGLVSRHGLIAYASSFDQIGPLAKSFDDVLEVMDVISGRDEYDSTCIADGLIKKSMDETTKKIKFAIIRQTIDPSKIAQEVQDGFGKLTKEIISQGHEINYVDIPILEYLVPAYYILTTAEASSNLSRYDGIKYGHKKDAQFLEQLISQTRTDGFGKEVKRRILLGTFVLSQGYYDAYYTKAQKIRGLIKKEIQEVLQKNNYILSPTTPGMPFKLGSKRKNTTDIYFEDIFTVQANLSGHPALAFPIYKSKEEFLVSAQLIGDYFSEIDMLNCAKKLIKI